MKGTYLLLLISFILSSGILNAQSNDQKIMMSDDEKCVSVMLDAKAGGLNVDSILLALVEKSNNKERLKHLLIYGFEGKAVNPSAEDLALQKEMQAIEAQIIAKEAARILELCKRYEIEKSKYDAFIIRWQSDTAFQQAMRPFIEKKLKQ